MEQRPHVGERLEMPELGGIDHRADRLHHAVRNVYRPGASDELVDIVRARKLPLVGAAGGIWSWIHIDDAASATVAAVERGAAGVYNIVDDEPAPVSEWLPVIAESVGAKPPQHVPVWVARLAVGEVGVSLMTQIRGSSNAKAKRELGWQPGWSSWREGFRDALTEPTGRLTAAA